MSDVMTRKVNWLARHTDYKLHVVLTERPDLEPFYKLDSSVEVVNFDIGFDRLDTMPKLRKLLLYNKLQHRYKKKLTDYLMQTKADVVVSALRRDINFLTSIPDGSRKVGELHFARSSYRVFNSSFIPKAICSCITSLWQGQLIKRLRQLSAFVVLTHEDAACWQEIENVAVIPNSIRQFPDSTALPHSKRIIAAGRYTYQKGFDLLLEAWSQLESQHPDWQLHIFGSGDRTPYQEMAKRLRLENVALHGTVDSLQAEMLKASVFAFSSRFEGFGLVLAEAMSSGLACVSFACPCGPADIIDRDGINGLLVKPNDVEGLASALDKVMSDPDLRLRLATEGRTAAQRYSEDFVMQQWVALFEQLRQPAG